MREREHDDRPLPPEPEAYAYDDGFDLDLRIIPARDPDAPDVMASGTCGGCPDWTEEGSTCKFSCQESCGGTCSCPPCGGFR